MLRALLKAHLHALWLFPRAMRSGNFHQIITYHLSGIGIIGVDCSCGRTFGLRDDWKVPYLSMRAASPNWYRGNRSE